MYPNNFMSNANSNYYSNANQNYTPSFQPSQPMCALAGRVVRDFSEITIRDIPTDGNMAYFVKYDGSEIQGRRWSENGSVIPVTYVLAESTPQEDPIQTRLDSLDERLKKIENSRRRKETDSE